MKVMIFQSNYEIQLRFKLINNEEHLRCKWKQHARENIRLKTFVEEILFKSIDDESKCHD
jgi:hypothetical protein